MSYSLDKLTAFERAVQQEAEHKIKQLQEEAKAYREQALAKEQEEQYAKMFEYMQEQVGFIKSRQKQSVTKYDLKIRRELVQFRNQLAEKVFEEAKEKLVAFSQTKEYREFLINKIKSAMEVFPFDSPTSLLKKEDLRFFEDIKENFSDTIFVEEDPNNHMGGFILFNKEHGVLVDETFYAVLEDQKQEFYSSCGLTIQY